MRTACWERASDAGMLLSVLVSALQDPSDSMGGWMATRWLIAGTG